MLRLIEPLTKRKARNNFAPSRVGFRIGPTGHRDNMTPITDHLYTPKEAAEYCRVNKNRILQAFKAKDLDGAQLNRRVIRFSRQQLDQWLKGDKSHHKDILDRQRRRRIAV